MESFDAWECYLGMQRRWKLPKEKDLYVEKTEFKTEDNMFHTTPKSLGSQREGMGYMSSSCPRGLY